MNKPWAAAAAIAAYAAIIGLTDNGVRLIAQDLGLWQFHATRTACVLVILALVAGPLGLRLRPRNFRPVMARSALLAFSMLFYFGALAFVPVAQAAAGLFAAPLFVLIINRLAFGEPITGLRLGAVVTGFVGIVLALDLREGTPIGLASLLPVLGGLLYAMGNITTRRWCEGESTEALTGGFFLVLGSFGLIGMIVLTLWPLGAPAGVDGFVLRGAAPVSLAQLALIAGQALGALIAVGLMVRGYQLTDATRASVFEYIVLPASALWGWVLWSELPSLLAVLGMGLIFAAGLLIASARG